MVLRCDTCDDDITPGKHPFDDEDNDTSHKLKINGSTKYLCMDCWMAISDWVESKECKDYVKNYEKELGH